MSPLVVIGLTDLPKSGGAMAPPAPTGLKLKLEYIRLFIQKTRVNNQFLIYIREMVWDYNQTFQNQFCIFGTIV